MRLRTIWTIPAMDFRERLSRTREWAAIEVASHLPQRVRYWSFIMLAAQHIHNDDVVPEVRFMDLMERLEKTHS